MPELPEVETTCAGIRSHLVGRTLTDVVIRHQQLRWPVPVRQLRRCRGAVIEAVTRRAKYLLINIAGGNIILHLGMSGRLHVLDKETPVKKHDHLDFVLNDGRVLRFTDPRRFGACLWQKGEGETHPLLQKLGPEPLTKAFNTDYLFTALQSRRVAIKQAIMDNQVVVGVGNIYAAESLFLAGIAPNLPANTLSRARITTLIKAIKSILKKAIQQGGTTLKDFLKADGHPGYFQQQLKVYGRAGQACYRCKHALVTCKMGQRSTVYCPGCQV